MIERRNQLALPVDRQLPARVFLVLDIDPECLPHIRRGQTPGIAYRHIRVQGYVVELQQTEKVHPRCLCGTWKRHPGFQAERRWMPGLAVRGQRHREEHDGRQYSS